MRALEYQLELKPEDFKVIPSLNVAIAKTKVKTAGGNTLVNITRYEVKLLTQSLGSNYFLPTSAQWSKSREYLEQKYPELEKDFVTGEYEWVDSLLAFPNEKGEYSGRLQIPGIRKGKVPLLIEQSKVEKKGNYYFLTEGKVIEVPELPLKSGYIQAWDEDLGLPTKVGENPNEKFEGAYFWVDTNYKYHEGLRGIIRGRWCWSGYERRFSIAADWPPCVSGWGLSFRLAKAVSADEDFIKMPRKEYERLLKLSKELNELLNVS